MSLTAKSITAKLLAEENISIVHENIPTAAFDVKNRVLHLPTWENITDDTYSLLIGHEVGHAKYTPETGWHDAVCDKGNVYKSYLNVVEDARIEKLIQRRYPGLSRSFKKGYQHLLNEGFFGVDKEQVKHLNLIDRINTYFKCGASMQIPFSAEESVWLDKISKLESWEETESLTDELFAFCKERAEQEQENHFEDGADESGEGEMEWDDEDSELSMEGDMSDWESEESDSEEENGSSASQETDDTGEEEGTEDSFGDASEEEEEKAETGYSPQGGVDGSMMSHTDKEIRKNIDNMSINENLTIKNYLFKGMEQNIVSYKELMKLQSDSEYVTDVESSRAILEAEHNSFYKHFLTENKRIIDNMVKEFEMRKRASEYARTKLSKSGSLDTVKMNNYKFSDDIFKKVAVEYKGKNHGFIFYLDCSSSMRPMFYDAVVQTVTLAMFCRKANIPYKVISFTSGWVSNDNMPTNLEEGTLFSLPNSKINLLFDDKMNKGQFAKMSGLLLAFSAYRSDKYIRGLTSSVYPVLWNIFRLFEMGGTPLDETILAGIKTCNEFKQEYRLDIVNTFFITDGESHRVSVQGKSYGMEVSYDENKGKSNLVDVKTGKHYRLYIGSGTGTKYSTTNACINLYKDRTGSNVIGYFISTSMNNCKHKFVDTVGYNTGWSCVGEWLRNLKKNGIAEIETNMAHDKYFVITAKSLQATGTSFEVGADASKAKIRSAFSKANQSKKTSRELTSRIMKICA